MCQCVNPIFDSKGMGLPNEASRNEKQTKRNPNSPNTEEMTKEHHGK